MTLLFWICLVLISYVYVGYPIILLSGILGRRRAIRRRQELPYVSVLVPAHNEEKSIRSKIENLLQLEYPRDKIEILVGNDGSTDRTEAMVRSFRASTVQLVNSEKRCGKSVIQNQLVSHADGSILVFTDADCFLAPDALRVLLRNFADPEVGLATNCAAIQNENETGVVENEGLYWKYERWLRREESSRGVLAMASGSLFAMRRSLWTDLDANVGDDFALPLRVARAGYRNVQEDGTSASTRLSQNQPRSMLRMKMRIVSKDLRGLLRNAACLNPFQTGAVAVALWSHKLLRWAVPYFLLGLFISSCALAGHEFFGVLALAQGGFYLIALAGLLGRRPLRFPLSVASSFCLVNFAALLGTLHCLSLRTVGRWETVR